MTHLHPLTLRVQIGLLNQSDGLASFSPGLPFRKPPRSCSITPPIVFFNVDTKYLFSYRQLLIFTLYYIPPASHVIFMYAHPVGRLWRAVHGLLLVLTAPDKQSKLRSRNANDPSNRKKKFIARMKYPGIEIVGRGVCRHKTQPREETLAAANKIHCSSKASRPSLVPFECQEQVSMARARPGEGEFR